MEMPMTSFIKAQRPIVFIIQKIFYMQKIMPQEREQKDFSLLVELSAKFFKVNRYSGSSFCHLIRDMVNCHLIIELEVWTVAADTGQLDGHFSSPRLSDYAVFLHDNFFQLT